MKYYSIRQLAKKLDVTRQAIHKRIKLGEIKAERYDFCWLIRFEEAERWIRVKSLKHGKIRKL
ncbi:helix-turn-helix domain-containing protein [Patescibacteria group bacterium]|nr:helix-turn-helix domain-containing protein [Patescibacteria group bacterium]